MKIKLIGAAGGEVTGSGYLIRTRKAVVLVDAGMFQGGKQSEAKNRLPQGARPEEIDSILLTHAHLDHTGRVPLLIKHGFVGTVYATATTGRNAMAKLIQSKHKLKSILPRQGEVLEL